MNFKTLRGMKFITFGDHFIPSDKIEDIEEGYNGIFNLFTVKVCLSSGNTIERYFKTEEERRNERDYIIAQMLRDNETKTH